MPDMRGPQALSATLRGLAAGRSPRGMVHRRVAGAASIVGLIDTRPKPAYTPASLRREAALVPAYRRLKPAAAQGEKE